MCFSLAAMPDDDPSVDDVQSAVFLEPPNYADSAQAPPISKNVSQYAKSFLSSKNIDIDLSAFFSELLACLTTQTFKKDNRIKLHEDTKTFIAGFEEIVKHDFKLNEKLKDQNECVKEHRREFQKLQVKHEQLQFEHDAACEDLYALREQQQLSALAAKQQLTTMPQKATKPANANKPPNATKPQNAAIQPKAKNQQNNQQQANAWNRIGNKDRQKAPNPPSTSNQPTLKEAPVNPRIPAPLPLVFTLPAVQIGEDLLPEKAQKVKAEVLIMLNAWSTGIKVRSISTNAACGKVFVRLADQKDVDKAFKVIDKALTEEGSKLEVRQLQPNLDEVFFVPGIPNDVEVKDVIPKLIELNAFLKPALSTMSIKKKVTLKKNENEYAVILSIGKEFAGLFKQRKVLVGYYRRWLQPALRKPFCGKCHRLGHFTKECTPAYLSSAATLGPDICVNCMEYNAKLATSKARNPDDGRKPRDTNHSSNKRQICLSYLSALGSHNVGHTHA